MRWCSPCGPCAAAADVCGQWWQPLDCSKPLAKLQGYVHLLHMLQQHIQQPETADTNHGEKRAGQGAA